MVDAISFQRRSANMSAIRSKDTKPEMIVRRLAHALGYRFRLHRKDLPGKPDIAFVSRRKAVMVNGCFWHQHQGCQDGQLPKSKLDYWLPKLRRNVERDAECQEALRKKGWAVLTIWECETADSEVLARRLTEFLDDG